MTQEYHDLPYLSALTKILVEGVEKGDRTGTGTQSYFGMQMRFDLREQFPLLTTKKTHMKSILWELLWFLRGETNVKWLQDRGVTIWDEWANENGDIGPSYGYQWRSWPTVKFIEGEVGDEHAMWLYHERTYIDQLAKVVETLKTNPDCRRMIVSAWNVGQVDQMALPACHLLFQFWAHEGQLSCQVYQRSCDMFLGVPFNIASYAALVHLIAHVCDMTPGDLIWTGGDCHIYSNHMDQVHEQRRRQPLPSPTLRIDPDAPKSIDGDWHRDHFILENYQSHGPIKAPVAV